MGWRRQFDLVLASRTPAINNRATLEKMIAASRRACCMITHVEMRHSVRDQLKSLLDWDEQKARIARSFFCAFNMLFLMGFYPEVEYFDRAWESETTFEDAELMHLNYFTSMCSESSTAATSITPSQSKIFSERAIRFKKLAYLRIVHIQIKKQFHESAALSLDVHGVQIGMQQICQPLHAHEPHVGCGALYPAEGAARDKIHPARLHRRQGRPLGVRTYAAHKIGVEYQHHIRIVGHDLFKRDLELGVFRAWRAHVHTVRACGFKHLRTLGILTDRGKPVGFQRHIHARAPIRGQIFHGCRHPVQRCVSIGRKALPALFAIIQPPHCQKTGRHILHA